MHYCFVGFFCQVCFFLFPLQDITISTSLSHVVLSNLASSQPRHKVRNVCLKVDDSFTPADRGFSLRSSTSFTSSFLHLWCFFPSSSVLPFPNPFSFSHTFRDRLGRGGNSRRLFPPFSSNVLSIFLRDLVTHSRFFCMFYPIDSFLVQSSDGQSA